MSYPFYQIILSTKMDKKFDACQDKTVLANGESVDIDGTSCIRIRRFLSLKCHFVFVYIINAATHPLIFGSGYMVNKKLLDFSRCAKISQCKQITKVTSPVYLSVAPNSECVVKGVLGTSAPV